MTLTPEQLADLKALLINVRSAPWVYDPGDMEVIAEDRCEVVCELSDLSGGAESDYDGRFIAAAREAVPALIAEVERLTREHEHAREVIRAAGAKIAPHTLSEYVAEHEQARAVFREWMKGCSHAAAGHPEGCSDCTAAFREALAAHLGT